jgi:hypothetical protein
MIIINLDKAKVIGHQKRRIKAQEFFAPLDKIIQLNIPGQEENRNLAESKRLIIRQKDAECQIKIDSANNMDEIKLALDLFVD